MPSHADASATRKSFEYPKDRFDVKPNGKRVGAHRISGKNAGMSSFLVVGLVTTVLVFTAGVFWVNIVASSDGGTSVISPEVDSTPDAVPAVVDPAATVAILNGTELDPLSNAVEAAIISGNLGQVVFAQVAEDRAVKISAVFYQDPADESAAKGLAAQLGGVSTYQTDQYVDLGSRLVVLLGSDYAGPGLAEAQAAQQAIVVEPIDEVVSSDQPLDTSLEVPAG